MAHICIARIGAAHGVRGAVKLWTFTEDPFAVKAYGPLLTKDGARSFEIATAREAKDHLVATFKGVATREDAERLNGIELYIAREKLPATDENEYYHADLIGLAAVHRRMSRSAALLRFTISAPAILSRSHRRMARPCCCPSPVPWCPRSILPAAAW